MTAVVEDVVDDPSELTLLVMVPTAVVLCIESATGMIIGTLEGVLLLDIMLVTRVALVR